MLKFVEALMPEYRHRAVVSATDRARLDPSQRPNCSASRTRLSSPLFNEVCHQGATKVLVVGSWLARVSRVALDCWGLGLGRQC
jgi:hypothetical protein